MALISIDTNDPRAIYVQIVDEVRRAIVVGSLAPDDPLPSVRQLAGELGVNPNTVKQAYQELERQGVTYVERGTGTFVAKGRASREDRAAVARRVAERALQEATRNGLAVEELVDAIERASKRNGRGRHT
jgi:GntR family transcriptional regulator